MDDKHFPKLSIITPSYNQSQYLEYTIKSIIAQQYPNLEYIIIDGGSSDNSLEIIKKYEKYLSFWISEKDEGQSAAINKGLKIATGDIIAYCNSDDIYLPGSFAKISNFFLKNPSVDLVYGDAFIIDSANRIIDEKRELPFDYFMACVNGFGRIIFDPSTFFRKKLLAKVGYLNEELHYIMDGDFFFRVAQVGNISHIPKKIAAMRVHPRAKSLQIANDYERFNYEYYREFRNSFKTLKLSQYISHDLFNRLKFIFRLKRILVRFCYGHYFKKIKFSLKRTYVKT